MNLWRWVGMGVFVEWRLNRHDAIREQQAHPKPAQPFGYPSIISVGFIVTVLAAFPIWCVWSLVPLRIGSIVFLVTVWGIVAIGCLACYRERRLTR